MSAGGDDPAGAAQVQLRYPVCFDCFEQIIQGLDLKIKQKESERDIYMRGLTKMEAKITKARGQDESKVKAELTMLELEEKELDKELALLDQ